MVMGPFSAKKSILGNLMFSDEVAIDDDPISLQTINIDASYWKEFYAALFYFVRCVCTRLCLSDTVVDAKRRVGRFECFEQTSY